MNDAATIVGAGSVGLALAVRLARAGSRVLLVTRRSEAARSLSERGVWAQDPASGQRVGVAVRATAELAGVCPASPIFVCTRSNAVEEIARALAKTTAPLVTFQNDVESENIAARWVPLVIGGVWRETATRVGDDGVRFLLAGPGRAVLGLHPHGRSSAVDGVAALLGGAGIEVSVSETIVRDKWLKLCVNLMSAPNALVRREDHVSQTFVDLKVRLLEEAQAALAAAGVEATPCDARDRTLEHEIAFQREALARGISARPIPLYNHVWTCLRHGGPLEADAYHERIVALARAHAVSAPVNERVLGRLRAAHDQHLGPECFAARELLAD